MVYSSAFEVKSFYVHSCHSTVLWDFTPCPPSLYYGKYEVSIMVPLFFTMTVPGGCRLQGCHGYPTRSAHVLVAPPSFQAPSPSSSIVDEFKCRFFFLHSSRKNLYNVSAKLLKQSTKLSVN